MNKFIQKIFKDKMIEKLKGRVKDPERFCKLMKKYNIVMAGSFPLQVLLEEDWKDSDIDLYLISKDVKEEMISNFKIASILSNNNLEIILDNKIIKKLFVKIEGKRFTKHGVIHASEFIYALGNDLHGFTSETKHYTAGDILRVGNYYDSSVDKKMNIQIIHLDPKKCSSVKSFVEKFDLDFCKVMFDGEKFTILHPESVINRISKYNKEDDWQDRKDKRVAHYRARGFTIYENTPDKKSTQSSDKMPKLEEEELEYNPELKNEIKEEDTSDDNIILNLLKQYKN